MNITEKIVAHSNAQMVAKMEHLSEEMGREMATSEEARKILDLKGLDL